MISSKGWSVPFTLSGHTSPRSHYFLRSDTSLCGLRTPHPTQLLAEHIVGRKPSPTECSFCWEAKAKLGS